MGDFDECYDRTDKNESGYANVKGDNGGETYAGISRVFYPNSKIWRFVDKNKPLKRGQRIDDPELHRLVKEFYKVEFWDKLKMDVWTNQGFAEEIYDFTVTAGHTPGIKLAQRSLGLPQTGKLDEATMAVLTKDNSDVA